MALNKHQFTFRGIFKSYGLRSVFCAWDFLLAALLAASGTYCYVRGAAPRGASVSLVGDYLSIASALFGVVIAGFAIAAALVNERYAQMLNDAGTDPFRLLRHFVFEGALLVTAILAAIAYRAAGPTLYVDHRGAEQALLFLATLLFLWGLFFALELMKLVLGVAVTSAALFRLSSPPNESSGESRPDSE